MNRYLGYGSLLLVIVWLTLSYSSWLPDRVRIEASVARYGDWFQLGTILVLLIFGLIQLWLVYVTFRLLHRRQEAGIRSTPDGFTLNLVGEIFWTALPLLLTIALAFVGYKLWSSL